MAREFRNRKGLGRRAVGLAGVVALSLGLASCSSGDSLEGGGESSSGVITIGSSDFSENVLLAYIYAEALEEAGYKTDVKPNIGSREITFPALEDGSIDMVPEYAGSLLAYLDSDVEAFDTPDIVDGLHAALPEQFVVLEPANAENKDVKVVTAEFANDHDLNSISDLEPIQDEVIFGGPPESTERRAGLKGITDVYGMEFGEFVPLDGGGPLTVAGLKGGDVNVAQMYSTQPAIAENSFVVLEDPLHIATAENVIPLVRVSILTQELEAAIDEVTASLTTDILIRLNTLVEVDKQDPQQVAKDYVESL